MSRNSRLCDRWKYVADLRFFGLVLRSSPGLWAATAASYCPSREGELPKQNMTKSHKRWDGKLCSGNKHLYNGTHPKGLFRRQKHLRPGQAADGQAALPGPGGVLRQPGALPEEAGGAVQLSVQEWPTDLGFSEVCNKDYTGCPISSETWAWVG